MSKYLKYEPIGSRVLVVPIEPTEKTESGLYIPDMAKKVLNRGLVVATGPGEMKEDGTRAPMQVKVGDDVIYGKYSGGEVETDDGRVVVMQEKDIFTIVRKN